MKVNDLTGQRFGRLIVITRGEPFPEGNYKRVAWICRCDCGSEIRVRGKSLSNSSTRSCGCLSKEIKKTNRNKPHNLICEICGTSFISTCPVCKPQKTCSAECNRIRINIRNKPYRYKDFEHYLKTLYSNVSRRAKQNGLTCSITLDDLIEIFSKQKGICRVTGIKFALPELIMEKYSRYPWAPSVDQILPGLGYTKNNIRLVCNIYNQAKHIWTDEIVRTMAEAVVHIRDSKEADEA